QIVVGPGQELYLGDERSRMAFSAGSEVAELRRANAELQQRLEEGLAREAATAEILRVISGSPIVIERRGHVLLRRCRAPDRMIPPAGPKAPGWAEGAIRSGCRAAAVRRGASSRSRAAAITLRSRASSRHEGARATAVSLNPPRMP